MTALMILGMVALVLAMRNPNRWPDLFLPASIAGLILLAMVYWLIHIRRMEKMLQEERNLLRTLIDTLPDSIFIKDVMSRIVIDNNARWCTPTILALFCHEASTFLWYYFTG